MTTVPLYTEGKETVRDDLRILFVAIGHAGIRLISHLPKRVPELRYAAVDTDQESLDDCPFDQKMLISTSESAGMGSGGDMEAAAKLAEDHEDEFRDLLHNVRMVVVVAGLGGGTGGGIGPRFVDVARDSGKIVLAALVQPLEAEGGSRKHAADAALIEYRESSHAVMLFPLESLKAREDPSMLLSRLLKRCGMEISRSLGGLAVLLRTGWLLPLSLQDVVKVMNRADGYCRLVAVSSDTENRVDDVLEKLFSHPLIDKGSLLAHSGGVVLGVLCGPQTLLSDLEKISMEVRKVLRSDSELKFGVAQDDRIGRNLGLVVMVAERWSTVIAEPGVIEEKLKPETGDESEKGALIQGEIDLAAPKTGRFKGLQPTIDEGADLDTPTFIRKGLKLSFHKSGKHS